MSEIIPPSEPSKEPEKPAPTKTYYQTKPLSRKACAGLGFLLFVVSVGGTFAFPPLCVLGAIAAIASLFFQGYRFIFVGYILTIGVLLLGTIIYCSQHPLNLH